MTIDTKIPVKYYIVFMLFLLIGLIVLNVRWRNQVYSGALIDVEKTKWASERYK